MYNKVHKFFSKDVMKGFCYEYNLKKFKTEISLFFTVKTRLWVLEESQTFLRSNHHSINRLCAHTD